MLLVLRHGEAWLATWSQATAPQELVTVSGSKLRSGLEGLVTQSLLVRVDASIDSPLCGVIVADERVGGLAMRDYILVDHGGYVRSRDDTGVPLCRPTT